MSYKKYAHNIPVIYLCRIHNYNEMNYKYILGYTSNLDSELDIINYKYSKDWNIEVLLLSDAKNQNDEVCHKYKIYTDLKLDITNNLYDINYKIYNYLINNTNVLYNNSYYNISNNNIETYDKQRISKYDPVMKITR